MLKRNIYIGKKQEQNNMQVLIYIYINILAKLINIYILSVNSIYLSVMIYYISLMMIFIISPTAEYNNLLWTKHGIDSEQFHYNK